MRSAYWEDPRRTVKELALKLMEEAGEVAKAANDRAEGKSHNLLEELEHVRWIADCLEKKVKPKRRKRSRKKKPSSKRSVKPSVKPSKKSSSPSGELSGKVSVSSSPTGIVA